MTNIEEKIIKLMDLTKSPNEHEALQAAVMAQKLMAKYNISLANLKNNATPKSVNGITNSYGKSYRFQLAKIIADNFGVKNYYINKMTVAFYGRETSVMAAVKTYDYLHNVIHRMADSHQTKIWKAKHCTKGVYNSYVLGFLQGLKQVLDEQCKALAIVVPDDVEQQYTEFSADFTEFKSKGCCATYCRVDSFEAGKADGQTIGSDKKQIE